MKKFLFGLAAIALAVSSCSENEEISSDLTTSKKAINFAVYTQLATKGLTVYTDSVKTFKAVATRFGKEAQVFYEATDYTKGTNTYWESSPEYLWPNYTLNFYTYTDVISGTGSSFTQTITTSMARELDVTVATAIKDQADLIAGTKFNAGPEVTSGINFNHILSKISVEARNSNSNYVVKVKQVKLANFDNNGKFTYATPNDSTGSPKAWTNNSCGDNYFAGVMKQVGTNKNSDTSVDYLGTAKEDAKEFTLTDAYHRVMFDDYKKGEKNDTTVDWYLIPQEFKAWPTNASDAATDPYYMTTMAADTAKNCTYIALLISITSKDGSKVYPIGDDTYAWMAYPLTVADYQVLANETTGEKLSANTTPKLATATNGFAQGKNYIIKLDFFSSTNGGAGYSDPEAGEKPLGRPIIEPDPSKKYIRFAPNVNVWADGTSIEYSL